MKAVKILLGFVFLVVGILLIVIFRALVWKAILTVLGPFFLLVALVFFLLAKE